MLDNEAVFFSLDEFGEPATVNEVPVSVVIDELELEKRKLASVDGMSEVEVLFYIHGSHFKGIPKTGRMMEFNGRNYRIYSASEELGILTVTLARNEA